MPTGRLFTLDRTLLAGAVALYLAVGLALIGVGPGTHYDEAMFQAVAVHMLVSPATPPPFPHPEYGWVRAGGRFWPVMMMSHVGAVSAYVMAPVYALVTPGIGVARVAAAILGAFGLWGLGRFVGVGVGGAAAAAVALVLAVHPGYVSNTVFGDSGFPFWMAALGVLCLTLRVYMTRRTTFWAVATGLACGLGIWTRLNFAWLVAAVAVGALAGFGRRVLPSSRHAAAALAGALAGSLPVIGWQLLTRGRVTYAYLALHDALARDSAFFASRLRLLAAALLYDDEHRRGMWDGPALPAWEIAFVGGLAAAAVVAGFVGRNDEPHRWHRAASVTVLVLAGIMTWTRLPVREHHYLTLVPFVAVAAVLAFVRLGAWRRESRVALAALAIVYAAVALRWDAAAWRGLATTRGTGMWSDATVAVARYLDERHATQVSVFDWGYETSIYFVTAGRVSARELFWRPPDPGDAAWTFVPGGVYVAHAPAYVTPMGAAATDRFHQALAASGRRYSRRVFNDGRGQPHTEVFEFER